jgi:hypothetical protein
MFFMTELYNENGLSIEFDSALVGYWVKAGKIQKFVDDRSFDDFKGLEGFELFKKINAYDEMIMYNLTNQGLGIKDLESAISKVSLDQEKKFQAFLKANGL